jgi:hypothetical protein
MTADKTFKNISLMLVISFVMIFFEACYTNSFCFDINMQSIVSCTPNRIRYIDISNDSSSETYVITWENTSADAPKILNLKKIQQGYNVYKGWERKPISLTEFKLSGLAVYTISRMQGDAGRYSIKISTDEKGYIVKSSRISCDDGNVSK